MRHFFTLTCIFLIMPSIAIANDSTTCADGSGKIITGKDNTEYCMSKNRMNWWTALEWCAAINKTLIHFPEDCQCKEGKCPDTTMSSCPNLNGIINDYAWTSTGSGQKSALLIRLFDGGVAYVERTFPYSAVCK